jgi:serine/threonine protein kinase
VYLVVERAQAFLPDIIPTGQLTEQHIAFLTYQLIRGVKYLHSANLTELELRPRNISIDEGSTGSRSMK